MSYLIGLYVYYHGNNLPAFGFIKGSQEIADQNQGLRTLDDIKYSDILPQHEIEVMQRQEQVRQENDYESLMRAAIIQSQQESYKLQRRGFVQNDVLDNTPDGMLDELYEGSDMDMGFFDELNGF